MANSPHLTTAEWAYPEVLFGFLDELREQDGYNLGTSHYSAAQALLLALVASSESPREDKPKISRGAAGTNRPNRLAFLLGPLLCSTAREQEEFPTLIAHWSGGAGKALAEACNERDRTGTPESLRSIPSALAEPSSKTTHNGRLAGILERIERGFRAWRWAVAIAIAVLLTGMLVLYSLQVKPTATHEPSSSQSTVAFSYVPSLSWVVATAVVLAAAYIGWRLWLALVARQFLARRTSRELPALKRVTVVAESGELFAPRPFQRVAQQLRRRVSIPGQELDLEATVSRTASQGGWPVPVTGRRLVRPEYLALIERAGPGDQRTRFADDLAERLAAQGILLERAYFDVDPRTCFRLTPATANAPASMTPLSLRELYSRYPERRLLLISGSEGLFSPTSGELASWVDQLLDWEHRAVLTPRLVGQWGRRERELAQYFTVLPATLEGLEKLAPAFEARGARPVDSTGETGGDMASLPEELRTRPQRWLGRNAPEPWLVEEVLAGLESYLGDAGFYWLAACAVYPDLNWNLTLSLGRALTSEGGEPLLDSRRLATLLELPWFRQGSMPDWLRRHLLSRLSRQKETMVRAAIEALLLTALDGSSDAADGAFALAIAALHRPALERLWKPVWRQFTRQPTTEQAVQDYVFREFMSVRGRRLAVALPDPIVRLLGRSRSGFRQRREPISPALRRVQATVGVLHALIGIGIISTFVGDRFNVNWLIFFILFAILGPALSVIAFSWRNTIQLAVGAYWSILMAWLFLKDIKFSPILFPFIALGLFFGYCFGRMNFISREHRQARLRQIIVATNVLFVTCGFLWTNLVKDDKWSGGLFLLLAYPLISSLVGLGYIEKSGWLILAGLQGLALIAIMIPLRRSPWVWLAVLPQLLALFASFKCWRSFKSDLAPSVLLGFFNKRQIDLAAQHRPQD